ncbi:CubicO group peptidase (beta-lactamase class C family) [Kitasatospora kifunensis]|uniref:CubicO group peptidase (Beta-lactamase class C family) n=2 Tax=Kitasatospora kifunensis TaxID=58351 RepID=A0A7W7R7L8_KITKI|nr:CubicO group peptidase (beta-lactamase class C family) [Kitasatospora kifunensis]
MTGRVLVSRLADEARLDEPVSDFLRTSEAFQGVTLRQLADHDVGIRDYEAILALAGQRSWDFWSQQDVSRLILSQPPLGPTGPHYSNSHYLLLAEVVRKISGKSLAAIARSCLFDAIGMEDSLFKSSPEQLIPGRARSYRPQPAGDGWQLADTSDSTIGPHGVFSSVADLVRWERSVAISTSVDSVLREKARSTRRERAGVNGIWHLGRSVRTRRGQLLFGHAGARFGFRSAVWTDEAGTTVVVLANRPDVEADQVADQVRDGLAGSGSTVESEPVLRQEPDCSADAATGRPAPRNGIYWSHTDGSLWRVRRTGDCLVLENNGGTMSFRKDNDGLWTDNPGSLQVISSDCEGTGPAIEIIWRTSGRRLVLATLAGTGSPRDAENRGATAEVFAQADLGLRFLWEEQAGEARLRTARSSRSLTQVDTYAWVGHGMLIRRAPGELVVDLPRARDVRLRRVGAE